MIQTVKRSLGNVYILMVIFIGLFAFSSYVYAATHLMTGSGGSGNGWGWSSNVGWLDMSPATGGVRYDDATDYLEGYAWSSNVGWIRFGQWQNCPTGSTVTACASRLDETYPSGAVIRGWARVCSAATTNGTNCPLSGTTQNPASNGWDGWISLSDLNEGAANDPYVAGNYGWTVEADGDISGFAWGSTVVGWLQAANLNLGTSLTPASPTLTLNVYNRDTDTVIPDGSLVGVNTNIDVRWTISPSHDSTNCTATGFTLPATPYPSGSAPQAGLSANTTYTYTLQCDNDGGSSPTLSVSVRVPRVPTTVLDAILNGSTVPYPPTIIVAGGDTLSMEWDTTSVESGDLVTCESTAGWGFSTGIGKPASGVDPVNLPPVNTAATYTVQCTGLGGASQASVEVEHPAPAVDIWVEPALLNTGDTTEVFWEITGRTPANCTLTSAGLSGSPIILSADSGTVTSEAIEGETDFILECVAEGITPADGGKATVNVIEEAVET